MTKTVTNDRSSPLVIAILVIGHSNSLVPGEQFISEPLMPEAGTADPSAMVRGEPGLPRSFRWRGEMLVIEKVLEVWKTNAAEGEGRGYLRRHWYKVSVNDGRVLTLYCLRQAKPGEPRWWLYTLNEASH